MKIIRTTTSVSPETKRLIDELAKVMGSSFSSLSGHFLDEAAPQMQQLLNALNDTSGGTPSLLHLAMIEAQRKALDAQTDFLEQTEEP